jgi:ATP-dependent RNA helicase DDX54/DBP10
MKESSDKKSNQTIIFVSTKHHVEYLNMLLTHAGYAVSCLYGTMDQTARSIHTTRFRNGKTNILIVTDIAARGIDIPVLENVVNYDFPPQSKIFVHRVGRTARAGRRGWAYSFVSMDEVPYLLDLQLFLGRSLVLSNPSTSKDQEYTQDLVVGNLPRTALDEDIEWLHKTIKDDPNLVCLVSTHVIFN